MAHCLVVNKILASSLITEYNVSNGILGRDLIICPEGAPRGPFHKLLGVVSFGDSNESWPDGLGSLRQSYRVPVLRLEFNDVDPEKRERLRTKADIVVGTNGPTAAHINALLDFGEPKIHKDGTILLHCYAGVSRSTAAAFILYALKIGAERLDQALERMNQSAVSRNAWPNRGMLRIAGEIMGMDLLAASQSLHERMQKEHVWQYV